MKITKIILRNDLSNEWAAVGEDVILLRGEPALEYCEDNSIKLKIGDGTSAWKDLPYFTTSTSSDVDLSSLTWGKLIGNPSSVLGSVSDKLKLNKIGYGDKPDVAAINTNMDIIEEHIVELENNTSSISSAIEQQSVAINEQKTAIEEAKNANAATNLELVSLKTYSQDLENRTEIVENSLDRVDYLIGELSNETETDVPAELLDMRIDIDGNTYQTAGARVRNTEYKIRDLQENLSDYIGVSVPDGLIYEGNKLYLSAKGEAICDPVEIIGGSGGSGGGNTYTISLTNALDTRIFSVTKEDEVILKFKYSSIDEDGYDDGSGVGLLTINGIRKNSFSVEQTEQELNVTSYLSTGENLVSIKVTNSEGASRTLTYTVNVVALGLTTTFPTMGLYRGPVAFQYRVTGIGEKKVHFILDDREMGVETISSNDTTRTFNIATQKDGAHFLKVYVEATTDGITVKSATLNIGLMWYSSETTFPMVMINYSGEEKIQGEAISIPYLVYDPYHEIAPITYNIYNADGSLYFTQKGQVDDTGKVWETQDYPAGQVKFEIVCDEASAYTVVSVDPSTFNSTIITDALALEFTAQNRSNYEENPEQWENNGYAATFTNFGWAGPDGWTTDDNGHAVLRFLPGGQMYIPFKPFETDVRSSGYTIEVELATHNVRDYDTTIIASYESDRGIIIKSQNASLSSEQSGVSIQFKEDSRVRISFVISQGGRRLIYVYINGILCGVTPYGETDNFKQPNPVGLTIGAENCGLDLYSMRFYSKAFTTIEQLNNFICDRSTVAEKIEVDKRNDILDTESENKESILLSYDKVKGIVPVMILECPQLPQYKGDKKKGMKCEYIDQLHPEYSFTAENVQFDVQGTSSSVYPVKNFKVKLNSGLTYTASGETAEGWLFDKDNSIPTKTFCLKADYASSEHANNVCLVDYYNTTCPYKMPPQEINSNVRQGVNGKPIMVFWKNSETGELECQGCYNMNDDKSNEATFGFVDTDITSIVSEPRIECWEWTNNNNALCLFKDAAAFDEIKVDKDGKEYPAWEDDLEPRYPDLDDHVYGEHEGEIDAIRAAIEWVVSTNTAAATNEDFETPIKYPHYKTNLTTSFTKDTVDYRLSKFKAEVSEYFILQPLLFYYLFTEVFLMIDSRAKNMFMTTFDGQHFFPIPYDFDTAIGINNEGALVFDYNLEDTDYVDGSKVFNGQESVLWINIRECYPSELRSMYQELRSDDNIPFSYDAVSKEMNEHQEVWPEMAWNYDAQFKYLDPYDRGANNLAMLQGNKQAQRDWWLYNAFKYRDSKYHAGEAASKFIILRVYNEGAITITPYSHIYARVQYGNAKDTTVRATRNVPVVFSTDGIDDLNDLETHIYSPDRIVDIGDLSSLRVGYCDVSDANKLQRLILGSNADGYTNGNLKTLEVGANELLREVNVANCVNLGTDITKVLNFTECPCLETLDASGTSITAAEFSNGGRLKTVHLPETITALTLRNQPNIETLDIAGYDNISTIVLENIKNIDIENLISKSEKLDRIRLVGVEWNATNEESLLNTINKLTTCDGLSADGSTTLVDSPVVTGRVYIDEISDTALETINDVFPELVVVVNGVAKFFVRFNDWNNTLLYRYIADEGTAVIDPIEEGLIEQPVREDTEDTKSTWRGWSDLPTSISKPQNIVAKYNNTYRVVFLDDNDNIIDGATQWVKDGESAVEPVEANYITAPTRESTAQYRYVWYGWDRDYTVITAPCDFKPLFNEITREYLVRFFNDLTVLQETYVPYGNYASYLGDQSEIKKIIGDESSIYYEFIGWDKDPATTQITGLVDFRAQFYFDGYIEDSWEDIAKAAANGDISKYGIGGRKYIEYTTADGTSLVEAEIVGINHDELAETSETYNNGEQTATFTFILKDLGLDKRMFNESVKAVPDVVNSETYCSGGWEESDVRAWMSTVLLQAMPADLQAAIKPVKKLSDGGFYDQTIHETTDSIWLPSAEELGYSSTNFITGQGTAYPVYIDAISREKRCDENTSLAIYWTRTTTRIRQHAIHYVDSSGNVQPRGGNLKSCLAFGFCI